MEVRNSDGMTVWVPNEAFEFIQKIWKPEYQWAPVPVDKSLARAPEQIAFIRAPSPGPEPTAPSTASNQTQNPNAPANEPKPAKKPSVLQAFRAFAGRRNGSAPPPQKPQSEPKATPEASKPVVPQLFSEILVGSEKPSATPSLPQPVSVPTPESKMPAIPPVPPTPNVVPGTPRTPRTPRTPLPPIETTLLQRRSRTSGDSPASAELETAITTVSSPGDTESLQTPSTATELESPRTPRDSFKRRSNRNTLPLPYIEGISGLSKPALQLSKLEYLGNDNYQPPQGPWPSVDNWRNYQQDNQWGGYQLNQDFHPGGWEAVENRRALPMPGDLSSPPGPWKLEDGRGDYRPKAGTRAAAWKTLDGSRRELDTKDNFVTRKQSNTAWHGSKKGFALRMDMHLNVEVQLKGSVSGDITLSSEALFAL
ncbi:hypothetical protein KVR01_000339 [Diaporthe batatas]|uniref:uncharacterized protein n=1 Tax=Diaporthe batatas TaxID=748121 RepID=UPI001D03E667|nr:uncharacterized protein KVR01_000339 [Diaporthe batatas]KAG8169594.1 hypothetical protein KVR01_000339 [Diaporthe batatas]